LFGAVPPTLLCCWLARYKGVELANILDTEANNVTRLETKVLDSTVWKARINSGVNISFILVAVLCLAEIEHVWRQ
ncbi:hypothetical protein KCU95_g3385, partial [Aureobasidium melanogenum]